MDNNNDKGKGKAAEEEEKTTTTSFNETAPSNDVKATGIIVIGMAGSGKTTFLQRLNAHLHSTSRPPYLINLDPAVTHLPFEANIDIRDTVDYQQVMKQYHLGPNGGILTALNLFTTKFDQVLGLVDKRKQSVDYVLLDTPGQIEIFTWSASGAIITDALASSLPTCVAYIIDTPRTTNPATFMSNMLYACSILYKTRLPFILVFNKIDVEPHQFALEWMRDFESFQQALLDRRTGGTFGSQGTGGEGGTEGGYMDSLMNSMSLVLDEFYRQLRAVGVSAMTGEGMEQFFDAIQQAREEYLEDYLPELNKTIQQRNSEIEKGKKNSLSRLMGDLKIDSSDTTTTTTGGGGASTGVRKEEGGDDEDDEEEEEEEDSDEGEIIDHSSRTNYYDLPNERRKRGTAPLNNTTTGSGSGGRMGEDGTVWPMP